MKRKRFLIVLAAALGFALGVASVMRADAPAPAAIDRPVQQAVPGPAIR
jgi:hypothetical protein